MPRSERPRITGGLGEPDQQQCHGRDGDGCVVVPDEAEIGHLRDGKPARHVADKRHPVRAEIEQRRGQQSACHEHQRSRNRGRQTTQSKDHSERRNANEQGRPVDVTERPQPRPELAPRVVPLGGRPGELGHLADDHVDRRPRQESRDHRLRQEARDPPQPQEREQQEQQPGRQRDRRDQLRRLLPAEAGHHHRAPPRPPRATSSAPSRCAGTCRRARRQSRRRPPRTARSAAAPPRCPRSRGSSARPRR